LGQSRGGMMLFNWAPEHPRDVGCMAGIYPVTNLAGWPDLGGEKIQQAYDMSETELRKHLAKISPIERLAPLARAHVPLFLIHGDADTVVPLTENTLEFSRRYSALGGKVDVEVVHGKGHEEVPEFFHSQSLLEFLLQFLDAGDLKFHAHKQNAQAVGESGSVAADVVGHLVCRQIHESELITNHSFTHRDR
ncbi:MAG TPA: prolyl oligopeptidase family serine peptidase, partial [Terriglobia bacterium]|nr:prolyl oligopeptidase family serine peptidase [Terriglobia bacterium]